jgi:S-(hydroxymethyl)mycothiol dehydrogenase
VPCGSCALCRRGVPRRCSHAWVQPPRVRRARDAAPLAGTLSLGTLATHTVVHAVQAITMPTELPLRSGCLLGCGVSTGIGAATQTAKVWPGARIVVIGLGGIGLAALQGARIAGAERLVAVDIAAPKLEWASQFGATDTVDASAVDAVAAVRELTGGDGVDFAFEATGVPQVVSQAVAMLDYAGVAVAIGVPPIPAEITLAWNGTEHAAYPRKTSLLITDGGDPIPSEDFPEMARWALDGRLDLDGMVSREVGLDDLKEAFRAMLAGEVIRSVVVFDA